MVTKIDADFDSIFWIYSLCGFLFFEIVGADISHFFGLRWLSNCYHKFINFRKLNKVNCINQKTI